MLRDDFGPDSDVDVLVEFEEGRVPGFITFGDMQMELSELLEQDMDLKTPNALNRYFRGEVVANAVTQYE